jgi:hypothetical protein
MEKAQRAQNAIATSPRLSASLCSIDAAAPCAPAATEGARRNDADSLQLTAMFADLVRVVACREYCSLGREDIARARHAVETMRGRKLMTTIFRRCSSRRSFPRHQAPIRERRRYPLIRPAYRRWPPKHANTNHRHRRVFPARASTRPRPSIASASSPREYTSLST